LEVEKKDEDKDQDEGHGSKGIIDLFKNKVYRRDT
jgi:hypothetical protein